MDFTTQSHPKVLSGDQPPLHPLGVAMVSTVATDQRPPLWAFLAGAGVDEGCARNIFRYGVLTIWLVFLERVMLFVGFWGVGCFCGKTSSIAWTLQCLFYPLTITHCCWYMIGVGPRTKTCSSAMELKQLERRYFASSYRAKVCEYYTLQDDGARGST